MSSPLLKTPFAFGERGFSFYTCRTSLATLKAILFCLLLLLPGWLFGQSRDSLRLQQSITPFSGFTPSHADSLDGFHLSDTPEFGTLHLGNLGLRTFPLQHSQPVFTPFTSSFFEPQETPVFYTAALPFTSAYYSLGTNKAQHLNVLHTQNLSSYWNVALRYRKVKSEGQYLSQSSNNDRISLSSWFVTHNQRYRIALDVGYERYNRKENGGLRSDSSFTAGQYTNPMLYPVRLSEAVNYFINFRAAVQQQYFLFFNDSTRSDGLALTHSAAYEAQDQQYSDFGARDFYSQIWYDSTRTLDRASVKRIQNRVGLRYSEKRFSWSAGMEHTWGDYRNREKDTATSLYALYAAFAMQRDSVWNLSLDGRYFVAGYHQGDAQVNARYIRLLTATWNAGAEVAYFRQQPFINQFFYRSNHFQWDNRFDPSSVVSSALYTGHTSGNWRAKVAFTRYAQLIYLDSTVTFQQSAAPVDFLQFDLQKNFNLGKRWHWNNRLVYQRELSNTRLLRYPEWLLRSSFYFSGSAWGMPFNIGMDVNWFSAYYANAYMPALNSFYLQDRKKTGNYPYFDFFFESRIKGAVRCFIALTHLNEGILLDRTYFTAPDYPMQKRVLRFGLSWNFVN